VNCTKAIIAVGGFGTRRLPIAKAIEKCMLPIGNRPIVDYLVDDCLQAGITDIIFVVSEQSEQIRTYYGHNTLLEGYLALNNKQAALEQVIALRQKAKVRFVVQDARQPYGTSVPLWLARDHIQPGEAFLFMYGDNVFYNPDGSSEVAAFLRQAQSANTPSALLAVEVPHERVSQYGILATRQKGGVELYEHIVEKPQPKDAPSNLNNAGLFLLQDSIFSYVQRSIEQSPQVEKYLTDAVNWYAAGGNDVAVIRAHGEYLDCGVMEGWLYANQRVLADSP
jgi:UTP--glucose-1-phosphate uridylyltransferase